jgi:hypothetical protein
MHSRIFTPTLSCLILFGTTWVGRPFALAAEDSNLQEDTAATKNLRTEKANEATSPPNDSAGATFLISPEDADFEKPLRDFVAEGRSRIKDFFGAPIPKPFTVRLSPSRNAFTEFFKKKWGITESQCWWVAAGVADTFIMLSPRVWAKEACEHDAHDADHVKGIVMHELVHVFHAQHNAKVEELEEIGWFVEGLAAYASGQLEGRHKGAARKAIETNAAPKKLAKAWSGPHRYGVSGSLVQYIDVTYGREMILKMLPVASQTDLLNMIKLTEPQLLDAWRKFVLAETQQ